MRIGDGRVVLTRGGIVRRYSGFLMIVGVLLVLLPQPAVAWRSGHGAWGTQPWGPISVVPFPTPLPYGSRFHYPPGVPLSSYDPGSGTTYCLSQPTGMYYVCGYSLPVREPAGVAVRMSPAGAAPPGEQSLPAASGVLIFRLPQDAEAAVDGAPVGLSQGLGITSVTPGQHRIVVRTSGTETEHAVTVNPHAIFTVTPTAIIPNAP